MARRTGPIDGQPFPLEMPSDLSSDQFQRIVTILREKNISTLTRPPYIVGYVRVSKTDWRTKAKNGDGKRSLEYGLSIQEQIETINRYREYIISKTPGLEMGPMYVDEEVSAIKLKLYNRPNGRRMIFALDAGDHVVFKRLDRGFRKAIDMLTWMEQWDRKGVAFHFTDVNLDTSSPSGRILIQVMAVFAEYEGALIRQRNQDIADRRRQRTPECQHLANSGKRGFIGYQKRGKRGRKYLVAGTPAMVRWMGFIRWLREESFGPHEPPSYEMMASVLTAEAARMPSGVVWRDRVWRKATVSDWYHRAVELEIPPQRDPMPAGHE